TTGLRSTIREGRRGFPDAPRFVRARESTADRKVAGSPAPAGYPGERDAAGYPGERDAAGYPGERDAAGYPGERDPAGYPGERDPAGWRTRRPRGAGVDRSRGRAWQ